MMLMIGIGLGELHNKGFDHVAGLIMLMIGIGLREVHSKGFDDVNERNRVRGVAQQRFSRCEG